MQVSPERLASKLADPQLAASLSHFVRARVPEHEVADIVQSTLADALDAAQAPDEDGEIVRWVYGICRHKVVDWFRRARREVPRDLEAPEDGPVPAAAESAPQSAMDLLRWARKELPAGEENERTLEWMLREGAGEKLETIAAEANVPAPRVRQRVSRLRRYYKTRWAAQAAALAALVLVALAIALALRRQPEQVAPAPGPSFAPSAMPTAPEPIPELPPLAPAMSAEPPQAAPPSTKLDSMPRSDSTAKPPARKPVPKQAAPIGSGKPPVAVPDLKMGPRPMKGRAATKPASTEPSLPPQAAPPADTGFGAPAPAASGK
jgi:RNA polymerase sigma factor (sigma-70 family)